MTVQEVIEYARDSELRQLIFGELSDDSDVQESRDKAIISYINLGLIELYKRFALSVKAEIVRTNPEVNMYYLRNLDILKVIHIYDASGTTLVEQRSVDDEEYDIKQLTPITYLFRNPIDEDIAFVYTSSPARVGKLTDEVVILDVMLEALLHYIGYRANMTLDGAINAENNTHYMRFEKSCTELKNMGFGEVVHMPFKSIGSKGFV